jgi:hypothetical protein
MKGAGQIGPIRYKAKVPYVNYWENDRIVQMSNSKQINSNETT